PAALELGPRLREAGREGMRDVVVPGHGQNRRAEALQECGCTLVLGRAPAVREIARRDDQLRIEPRDQLMERGLDRALFTCADVEVRDVDHAGWHDRS